MSTHDPLKLIPAEELELLKLDRAAIQEANLLRHKAGHLVCRLHVEGEWFVLKWFEEDDPLEPRVYSILQANGVPTLPIRAQTHRGLLLEDLEHSQSWRAAGTADMSKAETGVDLADWYQKLHRAGSMAMRRAGGRSRLSPMRAGSGSGPQSAAAPPAAMDREPVDAGPGGSRQETRTA